MTELRMIEALRPDPPQDVRIVVPVTPEAMVEGVLFRVEYVPPDLIGVFGDEDLHLMAAAFATVVKALPTSTYLLLHWLVKRGGFDPEEIARYAEQNLGMERVETPVRRSGRKRGA